MNTAPSGRGSETTVARRQFLAGAGTAAAGLAQAIDRLASDDALRALVSKRINEIFSEGQLDECELTLKDLNAIAGAMVRVLEGLHHARPDYPARPPPEKDAGVHLVIRGQG